MITQERLKELYNYDTKTGIFTRRIDTHKGRHKAGTVVGTPHNAGYLVLRIDGKLYLLHRLAFLYVHGYMPIELDHKDRCRTNNSIDNLREVDRSKNNCNHTKQKGTSSKYRGV